jgi:hypothetical protein
MLEEIDYSEEAKHIFFESFKDQKNKKENLKCMLSNFAASFEFIKKQMEEKNIKITKKDYDSACKDLNLKVSQ